MLVIQEHHDGYTGNHAVAYDTEDIRYLVEEDESEGCSEYDLCIVEYRYFTGRRMSVGSSDSKLTACSGKACEKQHDGLVE